MTTIVLVRKNDELVVASDGQVSMGNTVIKRTANKVRKIEKRNVIAGFAGSTACSRFIRRGHRSDREQRGYCSREDNDAPTATNIKCRKGRFRRLITSRLGATEMQTLGALPNHGLRSLIANRTPLAVLRADTEQCHILVLQSSTNCCAT